MAESDEGAELKPCSEEELAPKKNVEPVNEEVADV